MHRSPIATRWIASWTPKWVTSAACDATIWWPRNGNMLKSWVAKTWKDAGNKDGLKMIHIYMYYTYNMVRLDNFDDNSTELTESKISRWILGDPWPPFIGCGGRFSPDLCSLTNRLVVNAITNFPLGMVSSFIFLETADGLGSLGFWVHHGLSMFITFSNSS